MNKRLGLITVAGYISTIFAANWAVERYGVVPVGFGLMAPAAVYLVGLAFTLRDLVQDWLGRVAVLVAMLVGGAVSALVSPRFAVASAAAFLVSELADLAVYTPLRDRNWLGAVAASNVVGLVFDSVLFLWLAFGSFKFLSGQIVGKLWMTLLAIAVLSVIRSHQEAAPA
jgi:hypothetical protein